MSEKEAKQNPGKHVFNLFKWQEREREWEEINFCFIPGQISEGWCYFRLKQDEKSIPGLPQGCQWPNY